jgi:putative oxidoreductase
MSARSLVQHLTKPASSSVESPAAIFFIRAMVGCVFISEGIQKFVFSESLGVGRFIKIGIPAPEVMAPFVGVVEIVCGALVLFGLLTHLVAIPLLIDISVAILATKLPMLLQSGLWKMAHEARTDFSMLLGLLFLLIVGGGQWSLDGMRTKRAEDLGRVT